MQNVSQTHGQTAGRAGRRMNIWTKERASLIQMRIDLMDVGTTKTISIACLAIGVPAHDLLEAVFLAGGDVCQHGLAVGHRQAAEHAQMLFRRRQTRVLNLKRHSTACGREAVEVANG